MEKHLGLFTIVLALFASYARAEVASLEDKRPQMVIQGDTAKPMSDDLIDRLPPFHFSLAIGPALSHGFGGKTDLLVGYAIGIHLDMGRLSPRIYLSSANSYGTTGMGELHGGVGADYYFTDGNTAPLAGLDVAYGWVKTAMKDSSGGQVRFTGASAGARAGWAFFRNTPMCLTVMGNYRSVFGQGARAGMYGLEFGLQF